MRDTSSSPFSSFIYFLICVATAMIGYNIHGSVFWAIVDFFVCPFAWLKWLILHEVSMTVIQNTFSFFFN